MNILYLKNMDCRCLWCQSKLNCPNCSQLVTKMDDFGEVRSDGVFSSENEAGTNSKKQQINEVLMMSSAEVCGSLGEGEENSQNSHDQLIEEPMMPLAGIWQGEDNNSQNFCDEIVQKPMMPLAEICGPLDDVENPSNPCDQITEEPMMPFAETYAPLDEDNGNLQNPFFPSNQVSSPQVTDLPNVKRVASFPEIKIMRKRTTFKDQSKRSRKQDLFEIHSEGQRLLRDSKIKVPYHTPPQRNLEEFLARKRQKFTVNPDFSTPFRKNSKHSHTEVCPKIPNQRGRSTSHTLTNDNEIIYEPHTRQPIIPNIDETTEEKSCVMDEAKINEDVSIRQENLSSVIDFTPQLSSFPDDLVINVPLSRSVSPPANEQYDELIERCVHHVSKNSQKESGVANTLSVPKDNNGNLTTEIMDTHAGRGEDEMEKPGAKLQKLKRKLQLGIQKKKELSFKKKKELEDINNEVKDFKSEDSENEENLDKLNEGSQDGDSDDSIKILYQKINKRNIIADEDSEIDSGNSSSKGSSSSHLSFRGQFSKKPVCGTFHSNLQHKHDARLGRYPQQMLDSHSSRPCAARKSTQVYPEQEEIDLTESPPEASREDYYASNGVSTPISQGFSGSCEKTEWNGGADELVALCSGKFPNSQSTFAQQSQSSTNDNSISSIMLEAPQERGHRQKSPTISLYGDNAILPEGKDESSDDDGVTNIQTSGTAAKDLGFMDCPPDIYEAIELCSGTFSSSSSAVLKYGSNSTNNGDSLCSNKIPSSEVSQNPTETEILMSKNEDSCDGCPTEEELFRCVDESQGMAVSLEDQDYSKNGQPNEEDYSVKDGQTSDQDYSDKDDQTSDQDSNSDQTDEQDSDKDQTSDQDDSNEDQTNEQDSNKDRTSEEDFSDKGQTSGQDYSDKADQVSDQDYSDGEDRTNDQHDHLQDNPSTKFQRGNTDKQRTAVFFEDQAYSDKEGRTSDEDYSDKEDQISDQDYSEEENQTVEQVYFNKEVRANVRDHHLQDNPSTEVETGNTDKETVAGFFDTEAELSGDDDEDDADDEGSEGDVEDEMEFANETVPSEEELRDQIGKIHNKKMMEEDKRNLLWFEEQFLEDGDLHTDGSGRGKKFVWRNQDVDDANEMRTTDDSPSGDDDDEERLKEQLEKRKFIEEQNAEEVESKQQHATDSVVKYSLLHKKQVFIRVSEDGPSCSSVRMVARKTSFLCRGKAYLNSTKDAAKEDDDSFKATKLMTFGYQETELTSVSTKPGLSNSSTRKEKPYVTPAFPKRKSVIDLLDKN